MVSTMLPAIPAAAASGSNTVDGYADPWQSGVNTSLTAVADADVDSSKFTYKEWTGETVGDVKNVEVFEVNRQPVDNTFAASAVVYDSVNNAIIGARDFKKEQSEYVQFLTGEDKNWQLTVVDNATQKTELNYDSFYQPAFQTDDAWKDVTLPCSWTRQGFDYSIYTNGFTQWQTDEYRSATDALWSPRAVRLWACTAPPSRWMRAWRPPAAVLT